MTFCVNYKKATGEIVSYQEGGDDSHNDCPVDCATLSFEKSYAPMFDANGVVVMKVDTAAKKLVFLREQEIPKALNQ